MMSKPEPRVPLLDDTNGSTEIPPTAASPSLNYLGSTLSSRRTLKQLWDEADKRFFDETTYHIDTAAPLHKDGVLQKWKSRYNGEKSSMQDKMDRLSPVLENIVNGIEIVGGLAASAASAVFGPAQICFNAITFVLDAPGKIREVYDCLEALFKEVAHFLVRFRVLGRIDEKGRLDVELLETANKLLISFTHICAVATKLLKKKRKVLQALETVFLTNDSGVRVAMAEFKILADNQAQTVGVISLEHVLENEHLSQQILSEQSKVVAYFHSVATKEVDEKTKMINKQNVAEIQSKLFFNTELEHIERVDQTQQAVDTLPGTLNILLASDQYASWSSMNNMGISELYLSGGSGTGKTHLINTLCASLNQKRQNMLKEAPSLYIAYHSFAKRHTVVNSNNMVARALKSIALQVATQSTRYAAELVGQLRDQNLIVKDDSKRIWSILNLFQFRPPADSVMYLLFDGFVGDDGFSSMQTLRNLLVDAKTVDASGNSFKVCILLAGAPEIMHRANVHDSKIIELDKVNSKLLSLFIDREFRAQEILMESEQQIQKQKVEFANCLLQRSCGSFHTANQKIKQMKEALDEDATSDELEAIINQDIQRSAVQKAGEVFDALVGELSPRHFNQLRKILMWMLYGSKPYDFEVDELQALLRLDEKDQTLESLDKKISKRFHQVLHVVASSVCFRVGIEDYLRQSKDAETAQIDEGSRLISMTINIQNASKTEIQRFILDLNTQLSSDTSIFTVVQTNLPARNMRIVEVEALTEIVRLFLLALNEGVPDDTKNVFIYAFTELPGKLDELMKLKDKIPFTELRQIQAELINFLSEPCFVEQPPYNGYHGSLEEAWFGEKMAAKSFSICLEQCLEDLASQRHLQARQRRWLKQAANRNNNGPDYLREIALAVGERWRAVCLRDSDSTGKECVEWLGGYLEYSTANEDEHKSGGEHFASASRDSIEKDHKSELEEAYLHSEKPDQRHLKEDLQLPSGDPMKGPYTVNPVLVRLRRVADWVKDNLHAAEDHTIHFYCIAVSSKQIFADDMSIEYFEKIQSDGRIGWRAIAGLAEIKARQNLTDEAMTLFRHATTLARELHLEEKLADYETKIFVDVLRNVAEILVELDQVEDAFPYLRELLKYSPGDGEGHWSLFTALCTVERYEEASDLLEVWTQRSQDSDNQGPSAVLRMMATTYSLWEMIAFFEIARQQALRETLQTLFRLAAEEAGDRSQHFEQMALMFVLAVTYASSTSSDNHPEALRCLEEILENHHPEFSRSVWCESLIDSSFGFASRLKFDIIRKNMVSQNTSTSSSPEMYRDDLYRYITRIGAASNDSHREDSYWYVASLCTILGQPEWCRNFLRRDVAAGVEILSDEDPENDDIGVQYLLGALICHRSDLDAHIAFSLLDRNDRRETLLGHGGDNAEPRRALLPARCQCCRARIDRLAGYGVCRWCQEHRFCTPCVLRIKKGEKAPPPPICNADHDFVHFYHPECGEEELEGTQVLIDWEMQYEENGDLSRKGGRIVDLEVWLDKLRVEWDLPARSISSARAQA